MALTVICTAQVMSFWTSPMFLRQSLQMGSNVDLQASGNLYTNLSCTWSSLTLFWFYFFLQVCSFSVTQVTVNWYSRGPHNVCTTRFCRDISWKCPENLESLTSQAGQNRLTSHLDHERSDLMEFLSNTSGWRWEQHRIGVWCWYFEPDE